MIRLRSSGGFTKTEKFLDDLSQREVRRTEEMTLQRYADDLMRALYEATPKDTGETAQSWYYKITTQNNKVKINIYNSHIDNGAQIALLLQYGHATNGGGYVQGIDYINPAVQPIFDKIEQTFWKEVIT